MRVALRTAAACAAVGMAAIAAGEAQRTTQGLTQNVTASDPVSIRGNAVLTLLDGAPVLYDAAAGREMASFHGLHDPIYGLSLSPDGRRVVTTTSNSNSDFVPVPFRNEIQMWDAASGKQLWQISAPRGWQPQWSPDSRSVAFTREETTMWWDVGSGTRRTGNDGVVRFDDAGRTLAVIRKGDVRLLDAASQRPRCEVGAGAAAQIKSPVFSPDGNALAAVVRFPQDASVPDYKARREVRVWSTNTCGELQSFAIQADTFTELSFAKDGQQLLINLSRPAVAEIVDVRTGDVLKSFRPSPAEFVTDAQLSEDGRHLLLRTSYHKDRDRNSCSLWDVDAGLELHRWDEGYDGQGCAGFTGDGRNVIVLQGHRSVQLWSATTGEIVRDSAAAH